MEDPDFLSGKFDTFYLDSHPDLYEYDYPLVSEDLVVALSAAIAAYEGL
jgi:pyruvate carboxylase subunit A